MLSNDPWLLKNGLEPQLAFTNGFDADLYQRAPSGGPANPNGSLPVSTALGIVNQVYTRSLETFYDDFHADMHHPGLRLLHGWQQFVRFGATALSIATILTLLGLAFGTRRTRLGVLLFGVGGLTLLIAPSLTANFWARYTVPMAGPLIAAAAMAIVGIIRAHPWRPADRPPQSAGGEDRAAIRPSPDRDR
jgi:hypothetical protein